MCKVYNNNHNNMVFKNNKNKIYDKQHKYSSVYSWISKMWYIHTMENYSAIKMKY